MHNCYSNGTYMQGYWALTFIILHFFLSPHLTLSFSASTLTSLSLLSLVPQSNLIDTISTERTRDDIWAWAMTSQPAPRTESLCISLACMGFGGPMRIATRWGWYFEGFGFGSMSEMYRSTRCTRKNYRACYRGRTRTTRT